LRQPRQDSIDNKFPKASSVIIDVSSVQTANRNEFFINDKRTTNAIIQRLEPMHLSQLLWDGGHRIFFAARLSDWVKGITKSSRVPQAPIAYVKVFVLYVKHL
jgi:hypothetical protein